jgi:outer membrane protein
MRRIQPILALLCVYLTLAPFSIAQEKQASPRTPVIQEPNGGFLGFIRRNYERSEIAPIDLGNSGRLESLLRAGKIYLSLQDAIALALENNLDIAIQRYTPFLAQADLLRASAGGLLRGVPSNVQGGASGVGAGVSGGGLGASTGGASGASSGSSGVNGVITQLGPTTPNLDPTFTGFMSWGHFSQPQSSTRVTGTTTLISRRQLYDFSVSKGFLTGTNAQLSFNNTLVNQNSFANLINPSIGSSLDLTVSQHLLQGFGFALNNRDIRVAKINLKVGDLTFKSQVINTVSGVILLYYDLVSFNQQVKVTQQALATAEKLYNDNKKQVEIGTLAPISIVQAEAEVATRQQDLTIAETNVLEQETILKNALSRTGVASPSVADARIVPTDSIRIPDVEPVQPVQDLIDQALQNRPELASSRLNIESAKIRLIGSRNGLLPTIDVFGELTNNALAGQINTVPPPPGSGFLPGSQGVPDPFFIGGFGSTLGQVFGRNFPDYRIGLQMNIPLRNRAARSDYVRDQLDFRQSELTLQRQVNQIRVDVKNAQIALQQARARYQAATKSRVLEEQTLDAEQKKYALGASTIYQVIQIQRDLATSQGNEVTAESNYIRAKTNLDVATGQLLSVHNVDIEEAKSGVVARPPSALPVLDQNGGNTGKGSR